MTLYCGTHAGRQDVFSCWSCEDERLLVPPSIEVELALQTGTGSITPNEGKHWSIGVVSVKGLGSARRLTKHHSRATEAPDPV